MWFRTALYRCISLVKFGIALPNSGPLANVSNIDRVAAETEDLGFDTLLVHDHISYDTGTRATRVAMAWSRRWSSAWVGAATRWKRGVSSSNV